MPDACSVGGQQEVYDDIDLSCRPGGRMLITARSKALLGSRPDATTVAHGGAQDIGLFAAPPIAFGASLSLSPPTYALARPGEVDGGTAEAILGLQPLVPPFTPFGLTPADPPLPFAQTSASPLSQAAAGLPATTQPVPATMATPIVEAVHGSSGGLIPHAGLPNMQAASQPTATTTTPSSSPVESHSPAAMLSQHVTALTHGIVSLPNQLGATTADILDDISETTAQTVYDLGDLALAVTQTLSAVPTIGAVADTVADIAAPIVDIAQDAPANLIAAVVAQPVDMLGDLAGADPIGGVTTLTSLVSAADILETHDEAPQTSGLFALHGATETLDGLIAGDPGDDDDGGGLLGVVPQDHGLLDGMTDHDGHGGLGLGLG